MRLPFGVRSLAIMMLVISVAGGKIFAQGCDQGIQDYTTACDTAPNGVVNASRCSTIFGSGGGPCYYCNLGSGDCIDSEGLDHPYTVATENFSPSCPSCSGCCASGSCSDPTHFACVNCTCHLISPLVLDTTGKGFHLTSATSGVVFDMAGDGHPLKMAWTAAGSGNAFLALDRNHNGTIDNGKELFGNFTEQPESAAPNGFLALAEFDKPENGGNGDGIIDARDSVFPHLLLWIDENHDGISQPKELHPLPELGVFSLSLQFRDKHYVDQYGNWFHYQALVNPDRNDGTSKDGRVAYDVFFALAHTDLSAQSNQWKSLDNDLPFGLPRQSSCPAQSQSNSGGAK